jgi:hypothetical protein
MGIAAAIPIKADARGADGVSLSFHRRARELGVGYAILHSTRQGRPLYERLGWASTSEMAIRWE